MTVGTLETLLRRDRLIVASALGGVAALSWAYLLWLAADMDMAGMNMGQLLQLAAASDQVEQVVAHILPHNVASSKLVARLGFSPAGSVVDIDGELVTRWELVLR